MSLVIRVQAEERAGGVTGPRKAGCVTQALRLGPVRTQASETWLWTDGGGGLDRRAR